MASAYLADPILKFPKPAFRAKRLIDFRTGTAALRKDHEGWLVEAAHAIPDNRKFTVYIFGYASKLGFQGQDLMRSDASNVALSFKRANQAARIMELINPRVTTRIDQFMAEGSHDYSAQDTDDSAFWRAVEVHIFLDDPPPHRRVPPRPRPVAVVLAFENGPSRPRVDLVEVLSPALCLQEI